MFIPIVSWRTSKTSADDVYKIYAPVKITKWVLLAIAAVVAAGILYEQVSRSFLNRKRPDAEAFCSIENNMVHFVKKGTGGPTVVFQSGLGSDWKIWRDIQDSVSKFTTTISYDRAGLLWSDKRDGKKTMENITDELTELLEQTNCPEPYVVVGHSLAGITLRPFIGRSHDDIGAILFVDVAHPLQLLRASEELRAYTVAPPEWLTTLLVETGVFRAVFSSRPFIAGLPVDHWYNQHITDYFYRSYKTVLQEAREDDAMFEEAGQVTTFGDIPLIIITGTYPDGVDFTKDQRLQEEYINLHMNNQAELLGLSSRSYQVFARHSSHYVPLQDPGIIIHEIKLRIDSLHAQGTGTPPQK